jgi:hypothetical protein
MYNNTKEINITILDLVKTVWNPTEALVATELAELADPADPE